MPEMQSGKAVFFLWYPQFLRGRKGILQLDQVYVWNFHITFRVSWNWQEQMDGWMEWSGSSLWCLSVRVGGGGYGHVVEGARASDDPLGKSYSTLTPPRNLNSRPQSHLFSLVLRDSALNSSEEPAGFLRMGLGGFVRGCCLMMSLSWMVRAVSNWVRAAGSTPTGWCFLTKTATLPKNLPQSLLTFSDSWGE